MSSERNLRRWYCLVIGLTCLGATAVPGIAAEAEEEPTATVQSLSGRSDYFGTEKADLRYRCTSATAVQSRLLWHYSAGARTLARGEQAFPLAANEPVEFALPIELPPVREGITLATQMVITLVDQEGQELARSEERIWLFSEDPFVARREWLEELEIHLYDPEGLTEAVFEEAEIPFRKVTNSNVLADLEGGLLIIGEGNSLLALRAAADAFYSLPQRGVTVVCLAPIDGELPWLTRENYPQLVSTQFASEQIVQQFDKRLSPGFALPSEESKLSRGMSLESRRGKLLLQLSDAQSTWPWWQFEFENRGRGIICCLPLVERWDDSPTPRYFFASLLEALSSETTFSPVEQ